jgi:hypothetical protein
MVDQPVAPRPPGPPVVPPPPPPAPPAWTPASTTPARDPTLLAFGYAVALLPAGAAALLFALAPGFFQPLFDDRVSVIGLPGGLLLLALVGVLTALGVIVVRLSGSALAIVLVFLCFAAPGLLIVIMGPAIVLIAISLRS